MTEQELSRLLSEKTPAVPRENVACVLTPDISRNAARLKKRRRDRLQTVFCVAAALIFTALSVAFFLIVRAAESPDSLLRFALLLLLGGMTATLLLAPALAWYSEKET